MKKEERKDVVIERDVEMNRSQSQKRENGEYIGVLDTIDTLEYIDRID